VPKNIIKYNKPPDLPASLPLDLPPNLPTDLPTDLATDLQPDLPLDIPPDLPQNLPPDTPPPCHLCGHCLSLLKSLGIPTPRSHHYHVFGPSLICLSPQVSLATEYLASREYLIEYLFHSVSLEEHQQSSTHNSRECLLAVTFLLSSLDSSLESNHTHCCGNIFPISPAQLSPCPL
jgi:hypothetical protein